MLKFTRMITRGTIEEKIQNFKHLKGNGFQQFYQWNGSFVSLSGKEIRIEFLEFSQNSLKNSVNSL